MEPLEVIPLNTKTKTSASIPTFVLKDHINTMYLTDV